MSTTARRKGNGDGADKLTKPEAFLLEKINRASPAGLQVAKPSSRLAMLLLMKGLVSEDVCEPLLMFATPAGRRLARGADLRGGKGASTLVDSPPKPVSRPVGRERAKPDTSTYEGRFAARLGDFVSKRGIDPRELAKTLGVNQSVVYDWLAGRKLPSIDRFPALAKALGVKKISDLIPAE